MKSKKNFIVASIYSLLCFFVYFVYSVLLHDLIIEQTGYIDSEKLFAFGILAFGMQIILGICLNRYKERSVISILGAVLVWIGAYAYSLEITSCVIASVGVAIFSVGVWSEILSINDKNGLALGVCSGMSVVGFLRGKISIEMNEFSYQETFGTFVLILCFIVVLYFILFMFNTEIYGKMKNRNKIKIIDIVSVIMLCLVLSYISCIGFYIEFDWIDNLNIVICSMIVILVGTALGGLLCKKIGYLRCGMISMVNVAVLSVFAFNNFILGILAIFFWSVCISVILSVINNLISNKGVAAGVIALAVLGGVILKNFIGGLTGFILGIPILDELDGEGIICLINLIYACILSGGIYCYYKSLLKNFELN